MLQLVITNIVATSNLRQKVNLKGTTGLTYVQFDQDIYPCAYVKTPSMHSRVSVFGSGKMISAGTKTVRAAKHDFIETMRYLVKEHLVRKVNPETRVHNIVLTGDFEEPLDVIQMHRNLSPSMYEPEQFPGVIYHPAKYPGVSILFFRSGKFVVAGLKSRLQLTDIRSYLESVGRLSSG